MKNDANEWHPKYKSFREWLAAEAGPEDPEIRRIRPRVKTLRTRTVVKP